jgi:hypothetical protein
MNYYGYDRIYINLLPPSQVVLPATTYLTRQTIVPGFCKTLSFRTLTVELYTLEKALSFEL